MASARRHASSITSRDSLKHRLPDGRILGYAEYGQPDGYPVFYFHGYPSCRLEGSAVHNVARRLGLRLISLDRPGFGLSSFQPDRRITDWPKDVLEFAKTQDLGRFGVIGSSGGGPYALACASALPRETMSSVTVLAGGPPWEAGKQYMGLEYRIFNHMLTYWPPVLVRKLCDGIVGLIRWVVTSGPLTKRIDAWLATNVKAKDANVEDEPPMPIPERRQLLLDSLFGGFAQGCGGLVEEGKLLTRPWGFRFEDVDYEVTMWHGKEDRNSPLVMMEYLAKRLPHCDLRIMEGTHYDAPNYLDEIFEDIAKDAGISQPKKLE